jgi:hypothetical protein
MSERIRALLLEANGTHWVAVGVDTFAPRGLSRGSDAPQWIQRSPRLRKLFGERYAEASYMSDWRDAFVASPMLAVETCNITDLLGFWSRRRAIRDYDLVVILHSAAGDRMSILGRAASWFQNRRGKLAMFVGNEYDLMAEKIDFARRAGADYICTQLPLEAAIPLYKGCGAAIVAMPHALNPTVYRPTRTGSARTIDIGFVGDLYERLIGDRERTDIVEHFERRGAGLGLRCDIRRARMPRQEWADYLNTCHGVIGAESGTYFLQRDGAALRCAKDALRADPALRFEAVVERCFTNVGDAINGKAVSSRHFEPIGTMTCQLLVEGRYNGVLQADEHYISVNRDLSNIDDAVERFRDVNYRGRIATQAYEHVRSAHTYGHRVQRLLQLIFDARSASAPDMAVA